MSFVQNFFGVVEVEEEDLSETSSGVCTSSSNTSNNSELGKGLETLEAADCTTISNFFGYCLPQPMFSFFRKTSSKKGDHDKPSSFHEETSDSTVAMTDSTVSFTFSPPPAQQRRSNVKPCGHGTTAIAPRVPPQAKRREEFVTPPGSPEFKKNKVKELEDVVEPSQETKNLINQETKFQTQLNDLSKQLLARDAEANKLRFEMEELQRDVFAKSAGMDRLQAELNAAHKETEIVKHRIKHLESDLELSRQTNSNLSEEIASKQESFGQSETNLKNRILELELLVKELRDRIESLESQLTQVQQERQELTEKYSQLLEEREQEKIKLTETLQQAADQKREIEKKWKEDFEKIRTINIMKEQQLLDDFEWKLREVQRTCKARLEDKDKEIAVKMQQAQQNTESKMQEVQEMMQRIENLKLYESEVEELRGQTEDQKQTLLKLKEQHDEMKDTENRLKEETRRLRTLVEMEKENIQHMQRIHHQEIVDKERCLKQTLNQKRTEIAMYWEERLLTECGRLKYELEQIHGEEKFMAMETIRREKDEEFARTQRDWEKKLRDCLKEISSLKAVLLEKDKYYHEEMVRVQTDTDRDIMELRRLMDKIDMMHHERYEKLMNDHENEIEKINKEHAKKLDQVQTNWSEQVSAMRSNLDLLKEQLEDESQQKIEALIQQHRSELDSQWDNLILQKGEALKLIEDEYITKFQQLEEHFYTQQKSHSSREVELLKTIDSLKNELSSKTSTIEDLQRNVDTLEGGVQVLNEELAQQNDLISKTRKESDKKTKHLENQINNLQEQHQNDLETARLRLMSHQKQSSETIDHLQRKCQCLNKLFEEVRSRYERRESRQDDLTIIADLRQIIAEQEKDLACLNEEKRFFQMRLIQLEQELDNGIVSFGEEEDYEEPSGVQLNEEAEEVVIEQSNFKHSLVSIPPTIPECEEG